MTDAVTRRRGPLQRVGAEDFTVAEEMLRTAAFLVVPEDQTQRMAFEKLMPHLYVLRNKGCSWAQLTKLLSQCGFKLQPSSVRQYYSEMLAERMDICQARMNEQIAILAAVRTETAGTDLSKISTRVNAFMARLQQTTGSRVDAMFGLEANQSGDAPAMSQLPKPALTTSKTTPPSAAIDSGSAFAAKNHPEATEEETTGSFGLLGLGPTPKTSSGPAFFNLDPENSSNQTASETVSLAAKLPKQPAAQIAEPTAKPSKTIESANKAPRPDSSGKVAKRVRALQEGIPPLKERRANVPAEVYDDPDLLMEHPAIPGLMLDRAQRLYGASLEYCDVEGDEAGVIKVEDPTQKRFRVLWRQQAVVTQTRTGDSFIKMDAALFPQT